MLLNTIDTSSMHSISSLLDTITHLTPGAQPGETTCQRNADNGSLERETERETERECVFVLTQWGATLVIMGVGGASARACLCLAVSRASQ